MKRPTPSELVTQALTLLELELFEVIGKTWEGAEVLGALAKTRERLEEELAGARWSRVVEVRPAKP